MVNYKTTSGVLVPMNYVYIINLFLSVKVIELLHCVCVCVRGFHWAGLFYDIRIEFQLP